MNYLFFFDMSSLDRFTPKIRFTSELNKSVDAFRTFQNTESKPFMAVMRARSAYSRTFSPIRVSLNKALRIYIARTLKIPNKNVFFVFLFFEFWIKKKSVKILLTLLKFCSSRSKFCSAKSSSTSILFRNDLRPKSTSSVLTMAWTKQGKPPPRLVEHSLPLKFSSRIALNMWSSHLLGCSQYVLHFDLFY